MPPLPPIPANPLYVDALMPLVNAAREFGPLALDYEQAGQALTPRKRKQRQVATGDAVAARLAEQHGASYGALDDIKWPLVYAINALQHAMDGLNRLIEETPTDEQREELDQARAFLIDFISEHQPTENVGCSVGEITSVAESVHHIRFTVLRIVAEEVCINVNADRWVLSPEHRPGPDA